ncbi:YcaO-like family protein [Streptomyces sp. ISL-99]|uniref:YcaO-like family protein n=1 Tax=Streptomyces sp. ISL-99 TaxID=2819193 RepID=UPI001BE54EA5|nr:YcaO-like family protein [Streptomyces sp. ISL-99]MBT2526284.1 YcaO-like family protein [Streptomyces sp. ISL-99]
MTEERLRATGRGTLAVPRPGPVATPVPSAPELPPDVVTRLRVFNGPGPTPPTLRLAVADIADHTRTMPWQADRQAFGMSWTSPGQASRAAVGEAVERYCGTCPPDPEALVHGSHQQLLRRGLNALDPARLTLYSPTQYERQDFPFAPFLPDTPVHWVRGMSLTQNAEVYVPAFATYTLWRRMPRKHEEARHAFPVIGGIAAGTDHEHAIVSGLEEVIERDTVAVWWANAVPPPRLPVTDSFRELIGPALDGFEVDLTYLENQFGLPTIGAYVRSKAEGWLTMGFAIRAGSAEAAASKALAEAFSLQLTCRTLNTPEALARLADGYRNRNNPLKPWRPDSSYLDAYRADGRDAVELLCHQQLYLDERAAQRSLAWAAAGPDATWNDVPALPDSSPSPSPSLSTLQARIEAAGHEVLYVDLTTPEAEAAGMKVVRVIVPGTVGTAPAAYPALGGRRIQDAAVHLGWRETPLPEHQLNTFPIPHS